MDIEQNPVEPDALMRPTEALDGGIVDPPTETADPTAAAVERLALRVGDLSLLCDPDLGREVILPPSTTRLPHMPDWLQGVASVRGSLLPVIDLAQLFGIERHRDRHVYLLICGTGENAIGLLVEGLPVPLQFEADARVDGMPPHPAALDGHVRGAYYHGAAVWLDVELRGFFQMLGERINRPLPGR